LDDSEDEGHRGKDALPGAKRKEDGSRNARLEVRRRGGKEGIDWMRIEWKERFRGWMCLSG
jgi:hypothetical protein